MRYLISLIIAICFFLPGVVLANYATCISDGDYECAEEHDEVLYPFDHEDCLDDVYAQCCMEYPDDWPCAETEPLDEDDGGDAGSGTAPAGSGATIQNPLGNGASNPDLVIINMINAILGILGGLVFLVFIVGGFMFIFAAGNEEKVSSAKKILIWASLGLIVILMSYAIIQYVLAIFL